MSELNNFASDVYDQLETSRGGYGDYYDRVGRVLKMCQDVLPSTLPATDPDPAPAAPAEELEEPEENTGE